MNIKGKIYTRTNGSGVHYARIILPKELRAYVAKTAIWRSLATKDDAEARDVGIVTAIASRTVFQEAADRFLVDEASVIVIVETEIVGEKVDIDAVTAKMNEDEITRVKESLRQSFGLTGNEPQSGPTGFNGSPTDSTSGSSRTVKSSKKNRRQVKRIAKARWNPRRNLATMLLNISN